MNEVLQELGKILVPVEILESFEIKSIENKEEEILIRLEEKEGRIPEGIGNKEQAVLDGFCERLELQSFPAQGKAVYLGIYRRRWKEKGGGQRNYFNEYSFQAPGTKATKSFGAFLKETFGDRTNQL